MRTPSTTQIAHLFYSLQNCPCYNVIAFLDILQLKKTGHTSDLILVYLYNKSCFVHDYFLEVLSMHGNECACFGPRPSYLCRVSDIALGILSNVDISIARFWSKSRTFAFQTTSGCATCYATVACQLSNLCILCFLYVSV